MVSFGGAGLGLIEEAGHLCERLATGNLVELVEKQHDDQIELLQTWSCRLLSKRGCEVTRAQSYFRVVGCGSRHLSYVLRMSLPPRGGNDQLGWAYATNRATAPLKQQPRSRTWRR